MFDQDTFLYFDLLQKNMPGVSESGFIKTLEMFSQSKGRVNCFANKNQVILTFLNVDSKH